MEVCDRCLKEEVKINLKFVTKEFNICNKCASKIVEWLEKKPNKLENLMDMLGGTKK